MEDFTELAIGFLIIVLIAAIWAIGNAVVQTGLQVYINSRRFRKVTTMMIKNRIRKGDPIDRAEEFLSKREAQ